MSTGAAAGVAGYSDALARVTQLQSQLASVGTAFSGTNATGSTTASRSPGAASASAGTADSTFATQLQSALGTSDSSDVAAPETATGLLATSPDASGLSSLSATGLTGLTGLAPTTATGGAGLPANASSMLTSGQQQFASRLASDTGLDPGVVSSWVLSEESGSAATARQSQGNNDWLNIGYTDSATYGASDSVWGDPTRAADATAGWLKGQDTIPGYGTASSGVQAILQTAGQAPAAQIQALQGSGWASSGYPDLPAVYQQLND